MHPAAQSSGNENARPKPGVSSNWWAVKDSNLGPID